MIWTIDVWRSCCSRPRLDGPAARFDPYRTSPRSAASCRLTHKHLTLQLVWEEYRETQPDGYGYSRFCELYERWSRNQDVVLRQEHRAGEKMFVDWAGDTIPIHDPRTGEIRPASLFVAVLGASTYTFARATLSQDLGNCVD